MSGGGKALPLEVPGNNVGEEWINRVLRVKQMCQLTKIGCSWESVKYLSWVKPEILKDVWGIFAFLRELLYVVAPVAIEEEQYGRLGVLLQSAADAWMKARTLPETPRPKAFLRSANLHLNSKGSFSNAQKPWGQFTMHVAEKP